MCAGFATLAERLDAPAVPSPQRMSLYEPSPPPLVQLLDFASLGTPLTDATILDAEADEAAAATRESVYDLAALQGPVDAPVPPTSIAEDAVDVTDDEADP